MSNSEKKQRGAEKLARIPIKVEPTERPQRKPAWIRARSPAGPEVQRLKKVLRDKRLHTVCEEASCPNLGECFGHGTATFMIMGDICTRRCPFCDVAHGRPDALDPQEPAHLAETINAITGNAGGIRFDPLPVDDPKQRQPDITKAREVLGWEPKIPLEKGLPKTIAYFREIS